MKASIKVICSILISGLILTSVQSCKKYPEGPMVSFMSKKERVANTWKVDNYKIDGTDYTSLYSDYTETFTKEGDYSYSWGPVSGTGKWEFQNKNKEIKLTGINNQKSYTLIIQKLEEKQFWYYYMDGDKKKEFHLVPR